ncbi:MAG: DUF2905 family protein [Planctomycetota bacterium]
MEVKPSIPLLSRPPADVRMEREDFRLDFPLTIRTLLCILLSGLMWLPQSLSRRTSP